MNDLEKLLTDTRRRVESLPTATGTAACVAVELYLERLRSVVVDLCKPGSPLTVRDEEVISVLVDRVVLHHTVAAAEVDKHHAELLGATDGPPAHLQVVDYAGRIVPLVRPQEKTPENPARSAADVLRLYHPVVADAFEQLPHFDDPMVGRHCWAERLLGEAARVAPDAVCHVTLTQCAAITNRSKRTLEDWKRRDRSFPMPDTEGGGGSPCEWAWSSIRPYLEKKTKRSLPSTFPGDRFIRR